MAGRYVQVDEFERISGVRPLANQTRLSLNLLPAGRLCLYRWETSREAGYIGPGLGPQMFSVFQMLFLLFS